MVEITVKTHQLPCASTACSSNHPQIIAQYTSIFLESQETSIGNIKAYTFDKAAMDLTSPNSMWEQCQAFDDFHGSKLDKIENYLANESFSAVQEERIASAELILFIDQVWLDVEFRGRGFGLVALRKVIESLRPSSRKAVVMLQPGDIGAGGDDAHEASEKLTAYWARLDFDPWSESDESWLLLWLEVCQTQWKAVHV